MVRERFFSSSDFIMRDPVTAVSYTHLVLPTEEPETIPQRAEEITATFAGPPTEEPATQFARSIKNAEMLVLSRNAPKMINTTIYF